MKLTDEQLAVIQRHTDGYRINRERLVSYLEKHMEFNNKALKDYRIDRGMTQSEVAEAIGASVRTYQKWERGDSIPDGHYLLRLMNWLQIEDVQSLIKYDDYADSTNKEVPYE